MDAKIIAAFLPGKIIFSKQWSMVSEFSCKTPLTGQMRPLVTPKAKTHGTGLYVSGEPEISGTFATGG